MSLCLQERISRFKRKVSKVNSEALLKKSKRATEVNIQAANRFITAAIPELSKEQKLALKQVHIGTLCMRICNKNALPPRTSCSRMTTHLVCFIQAGAKRKGAPAEPAEVASPDEDQALTFLQQTMQEIAGGDT